MKRKITSIDDVTERRFSIQPRDIERHVVPIEELTLGLKHEKNTYSVILTAVNHGETILYEATMPAVGSDNYSQTKKKVEAGVIDYYKNASEALRQKRYRIRAYSNGTLDATFFTPYFQSEHKSK